MEENFLTDNPREESWFQGVTLIKSEIGFVGGPRYRARYKLSDGRFITVLHDQAVGNHAIVAFKVHKSNRANWALKY